MRELRSRGLRVPQDVSVTGFDNISLSEFTCPSLTTVHIPRRDLARMMLKMIMPGNPRMAAPSSYVIDAEVIIRESSGPFTGSSLLPGSR